MLTSHKVKAMARDLGAELCGIAGIDRFQAAPAPAHPCQALPACRSVVVVARRFPLSTTACDSTIPYTIVRNQLTAILDRLTFDLAWELEKQGVAAVPTGAIGPTNYDPDAQRHRGLISLKHAAACAGLGRIGKNTLLVNDAFGNMIWLGGILTNAELEPDPVATYETCPATCSLCIQACPVGALGDDCMNQVACWQHAFGPEGQGEWRIRCHRCRTVCPNHRGLRGGRTPSRTAT